MVSKIFLFLRECLEYIILLIVNLFSIIVQLLVETYEDGGIFFFAYVGFNLEILFLLLLRRSSSVIGFMAYSIKNGVVLFVITIIVSALIKNIVRSIVLGYALQISSALGIWLVVSGNVQITPVQIGFSVGAVLIYFIYQYSKPYRMGRRIRNRRRKMVRVLIAALKVGCLCTFGWLSILVIQESIHSGKRMVQQTGISSNVIVVRENVFSENMHVVEKFRQENWEIMTQLEKENACYELMQLTMIYLTGNVDEDTRYIMGKDYRERTGGFYSEDMNCIVADEKYCTNEYRQYSMSVVFHETFHWFEYKILVEGMDVDVRGLVNREHVKAYAYEFENYIDIKKDYDAYYSQLCEADAREFEGKMLAYVEGLME